MKPRIALIVVSALVLATASAQACAPAPSCWLKSSPSYLRSVCRSNAKLALSEIVLDEPEKLQDFVKACGKFGIQLGKSTDRVINEEVVNKLCPDPDARCKARDNPEFYKDDDPAFYNRITKPARPQ